ncbi:MAG: 5'-methylthioadenosine/S-adenosylhomocysteine nucleosidase [Anaerolineales bacterium]|nr:5'-methylthioadenosine/S-adenosylhomocysteine nucleosidase [Anaerolineales bacterium]
MTLLLVTPLTQERDGFLLACRQRGLNLQATQLGRLPATHLPELNLTVTVGGVGKAQYALQTQHALDTGGPWTGMVCAGTAGALADELRIGDVVVATRTIEHDFKYRLIDRPTPFFDGSPTLLAALHQVPANGHPFAVHFGKVASGDEDIASAERRAELRQDTQALVAAWEGAGGARVAEFNQLPFVELRGVSDAANQDAPQAFAQNLTAAMQNLAYFVMTWMNHA